MADQVERSHHGCFSAKLRPDGWAAAIWRAAERGDISCPVMMRDYISPSLDTTVLATGSLIRPFEAHPEQWQRVHADPALIPAALNEAVCGSSDSTSRATFAITSASASECTFASAGTWRAWK